MDVGRTVNHLFQQGALNDKEFNKIRALSNNDLPIRAAEELLNIVLSQTDDFFDCFLDSLTSWMFISGLYWKVCRVISVLHNYAYITRDK